MIKIIHLTSSHYPKYVLFCKRKAEQPFYSLPDVPPEAFAPHQSENKASTSVISKAPCVNRLVGVG